MAPSIQQICGPDDFARAFHVSRETLDRLATYEALLRQWQKAVNLVAPGTLENIWHRHFADSAQLLALAPQARAWLDLGSGAGFPGLVVAILLADRATGVPSPKVDPSPVVHFAQGGGESRITLLDSDTRKCAFLREVARRTGISPAIAVDILSTRAESPTTRTTLTPPEVICARALAPLTKLLGLAAPLSPPFAVGLYLKGKEAARELEAAEKSWEFNAELVPSVTDKDARIVVIRDLRSRPEE
jgi:16S rRNA (guanine527-N7)-methyltransferase